MHHAKEEGVIFDLLRNPKEIIVDERMVISKGMKVVKMELGEPDASGRRRRPVEKFQDLSTRLNLIQLSCHLEHLQTH